MSKYTQTLRQIVEQGINIFEGADYPIYDESHRAELEERIVQHYYFREIGVETVGQFIFNLHARMREILPAYNKVYMTQALEQRILDNYDVTETMTRATTGSTTDKRLYSDTPQGRVDLNSTQYVSQMNDDTENSSASEDWSRRMTGNIGVQTDADSVVKYWQSIRNVDMEIIAELNDLFMGVY